jgi:hypothetical protein
VHALAEPIVLAWLLENYGCCFMTMAVDQWTGEELMIASCEPRILYHYRWAELGIVSADWLAPVLISREARQRVLYKYETD